MSRLRLLQWPMVLWLALVWCALWGSLSPKILLSGVLVGVAVCVVFPLPSGPSRVMKRPRALNRAKRRWRRRGPGR